MDYTKLERNLTDMIAEEQLKLGYRREAVRLYYPLASLNRLLDTECDGVHMRQMLMGFCSAMEETYGEIGVTVENDRFCFTMPPKGSAYIHAHQPEHSFLADFINKVREHGCRVEDVFQIFRSYSDHVHIEQIDNGEFDYLVYFEDGKPDTFLYCLTLEPEHIIYHRFTREDYEGFEF